MNANELTFGVEIETVAPDSAVQNDGLRIGPYQHGIQVPYLPAGWTAEADGSIDNSRGRPQVRDRQPDPPRRRRAWPRSPRSCGRWKPKAIGSTQSTESTSMSSGTAIGPARPWPGWSRSSPTSRRACTRSPAPRAANAASYCGGVRKYGNDKDAKPNLDRNRYHALNLTNLARGTKETVEFRVFSGSLNAGQGRRLDPGVPGVGRAGLERQADAEVEPQAAQGRLEEGRRRPERGRTPDGLPGLGHRLRPHPRRPAVRLDLATSSRRTRSRPSSAGWPRSTTRKPETEETTMCGIFGFITKDGRGPGPGPPAADRRRDATPWPPRVRAGVAWTPTASPHVQTPGPGDRQPGRPRRCRGATIVVGHCRWATHGAPADNRNNHPHPAGRGWLVHNGVVHNHDGPGSKVSPRAARSATAKCSGCWWRGSPARWAGVRCRSRELQRARWRCWASGEAGPAVDCAKRQPALLWGDRRRILFRQPRRRIAGQGDGRHRCVRRGARV